jgi:hypothetical protein
MMMLASTAVSAIGQLAGGAGAKATAELNAFNIETDKTLGEAEAIQRSNDRLELYRTNLSANIASFAAQGRDVGSDRSVKAFLDRQKELAGRDVARSDFMGAMQAMNAQRQAYATRTEGRAQQASAVIGAFTTMAGGIYRYGDLGGTPTATSSAPMTSPRPTPRPW